MFLEAKRFVLDPLCECFHACEPFRALWEDVPVVHSICELPSNSHIKNRHRGSPKTNTLPLKHARAIRAIAAGTDVHELLFTTETLWSIQVCANVAKAGGDGAGWHDNRDRELTWTQFEVVMLPGMVPMSSLSWILKGNMFWPFFASTKRYQEKIQHKVHRHKSTYIRIRLYKCI